MLAQGRDAGNDAATRYVLLKQTIELATRGRDAVLATDAVSELATHFAVDGDQLELDTLRECFAPSMPPEQASAVVNQCIGLSESAMKVDRYDVADRALILAESAEHLANQPALMPLIATHHRDMNRQKSAAASALAAEHRLKNNPNDPDANFARGFYLAIMKGDWTAGLPLLAKGANPGFKAAATRDLANPQKTDGMLAAGDGWWDLSQNETGAVGSSLRQRAALWYSQLIKISSFTGLGRTRVDKRLAELASSDAPSGEIGAPSPIGSHLLSPMKRSVALFEAHKEEERIFHAICGNRVDVIRQSESVSKLQDSRLWSNCGIIVWGANRLRDLPAPAITPAFKMHLRGFVGNGGDLILFEQAGQGNMDIISDLFGVKTKGGPFPGVQFAVRDLQQRVTAVGYTPEKLAEVRFYNSYEPPRGSMVLLHDGDAKVITAVVTPFGKGHVVLIGTDLEPADLKLDEVLFEFLYGGTPQDGTR